MILVTGAGGKTGKAIVKRLAAGREPVRALAFHSEQTPELTGLGASEVVIGDMRDRGFMHAVFAGVRAVYHICPNVNPDEVVMAENALAGARAAGVEHFVYHSVLHPQVEAMPHHWLKMRVEERLFAAGVPFTILQPAPYMQNVLAYWEAIVNQGEYALPYSPAAPLSMVDLDNVAAAAARVLTEPGHAGATYELAGPQALSAYEVAQILGRVLGREVRAEQIELGEWERRARNSPMGAYAVETLLAMFNYYDRYGLMGNSHVLEWLLGRPPTRFEDFIAQRARGG